MRHLPILSALLLASAMSAQAQVTLDLHALQALPDNRAPGSGARTTTTMTPRVYASPPSRPPSAAPVPPPPAPALPETVPDTALINPVAPPPSSGSPPAPPPVSDNSKTAAAATPEGLRLTFSPGQSELSPDSAASLKQLAAAAPPGDSTTFNVQAYAQGAPDDPSTARRLSLARAMAVRGALVADGIASAHIFVRALGSQAGSGPPDRVDIDVMGGNDQVAAPR